MRRAKFCRCDLLAFAIQAGIPKTTCCPFFRGIGDSRLRRSSSEWNLWAGNSAKEHEKKGMRKHKLKSIALACNKKWTKKKPRFFSQSRSTSFDRPQNGRHFTGPSNLLYHQVYRRKNAQSWRIRGSPNIHKLRD